MSRAHYYIQDAQAALIRYNSFDKFTIASKPVTADYVHAGIFVPVFEINQQETQFVFSPLANAAANLMYWDKEAYASELVVSQGPSHIDSNRENHYAGTVDDNAILGDKDNKAKKRKAEAKESAKQKKVRHIRASEICNVVTDSCFRLRRLTCNSGVTATLNFMERNKRQTTMMAQLWKLQRLKKTSKMLKQSRLRLTLISITIAAGYVCAS